MEAGQFSFFREFLRPKRQVYLDHNATTPVNPEVRRYMNRVLKKYPGNPSSIYRMGREAADIMEEARLQVAGSIGARSNEILFTACATESNNAVINALSEHFFPGKKKIIASPIEHPSVFKTLENLKTKGIEVVYCGVDRMGRVDPDELSSLLDKQTFLVCCMLANNEIGSIQDMEAISRKTRDAGVLLLSDCTQALGKIPVDVQALGLDYASFSAHKLYGPKGIGALYIREGSPFSSFMHGGGQEDGSRAGTESLHNIAGFGAACARVDRLLEKSNRVARMKALFLDGLHRHFPQCIIQSPEEHCLPNTIHVRFPGMDNNKLLAMLDERGISVSAGSACSSGKKTVNRTLGSIGLGEAETEESLRFSLGAATGIRDIGYTLRTLRKCLDRKVISVGRFPPSDLKEEILSNKDFFLLDIRARISQSNIQGPTEAIRIPFGRLDRNLERIPRDKHVVVMCMKGNLSHVAAYYLLGKGYPRVSSLQGGLTRWHRIRNSRQ